MKQRAQEVEENFFMRAQSFARTACVWVCKLIRVFVLNFISYTEPNVSRTASHESARCVWEYCKGKKILFSFSAALYTHSRPMKTV